MSERGSATAEAACLSVVFVVIVVVIGAFGRLALVRADVEAAARDAARAASLRSSPGAALADATATATASMAGRGLACGDQRVELEAEHFGTGGAVAVVVSCELSLAELALLRLPGATTVTSRFVEPVDPLVAR